MELTFSALYHFLRLFVGRRRAYAAVYSLLYRIARKEVQRAYDNVLGTVEQQVSEVYGTVAKDQQADIIRGADCLLIHVPNCVFAERFKRWGAEELTKALCDADRDYWESRGLLVDKTTRFDGPGPCFIKLRQD